jgi:nucleotide-binding universal stress UspA family protein
MLISTDGSEVAQKGVDHGLSLAKSAGAKVTIVTVTERFPTYRAFALTLWVHRSWRHKR